MDEQLSTPETEEVGPTEEVVAEETQLEGSEVDQTQDDSSAPQESQPVDNSEQRINDLMSKWQSAEAQNKALQGRLDGLEDRFQPQEAKPEWESPDWQPQNYGEIAQIAKAEALKELEAKQLAMETERSQARERVNAQLEEIRQTDPKADENKLYDIANEYGLNDLRQAHKIHLLQEKAKIEGIEEGKKDHERKAGQQVASAPSGGEKSTSGTGSYDYYRNTSWGNLLDE